MALPFDATMKELLRYSHDWLECLGVHVQGPVEEISADLSTVSAPADKVFRIGEASPWLLHLELQASRDISLPRRLLKYNGLLHEKYELPVHSAVVLLRQQADEPNLSGVLQYQQRPELGGMHFTYRVVRVWQWSVEELLAGGLGTLPLVPLSAAVTEDRLPEVIQRIDQRLQTASPSEAAKLWTATYVLAGLRFPREFMAQLLHGVLTMKESVTWQAIIEEGEIKGVRATLLELGQIRFGEAGPSIEEALAKLTDRERLRRMSRRLLEVASWEELLATP
jgi:predicted transposase YdaD